MTIIIIGIVIGTVIGFFAAYPESGLSKAIGTITGSALGFCIGFIIALMGMSFLHTEEIVMEQSICGVEDSVYVFSLNSRHGKEEEYDSGQIYSYAVTDGEKKWIESVSCDEVYFYEGDYVPKVKIYKECIKKDMVYKMFSGKRKPIERIIKAEFYIPKGTVKSQYNIDLQ